MQPAKLLAGKRGLVMGVANDKSIAWGIAAAAAAQGAEIAFSYQMEGFGKRLKPLADSIGSDILIECDVAAEGATIEIHLGDPVASETLELRLSPKKAGVGRSSQSFSSVFRCARHC